MRDISAAVKLVCLVLVSATCFGVCGEGIADERVAKVDELFARYDSTHTPGAALAVIQKGKVIYAQGYGMANLDHGVPITPSSVFRIGFTSKQFTALCIALLALEGEVELDASVTTYVPELPGEVYGDELMELILTPGVPNNGDALDYAFGPRVSEYRGLKTISHGGGFVG